MDIDGVVKTGLKPIPGARDAIKLLRQKNIQFAFISNAGGILEVNKADEINEILNLDENDKIDGSEVVLSHTPLRKIVKEHENKTILATGKGNINNILNEYGYKKFITVEEYSHIYPNAIPSFFVNFDQQNISATIDRVQNRFGYELKKTDGKYDPITIDSVFIMSDISEWEKSVQVISDVAISKDGLPGTIGDTQSIKCYVTGNDFVFKSDYKINRYGLGAFVRTLQILHQENYGRELEINFIGKPYEPIFEYAKDLIEDHNSKFLYMIGDNPASDILGGRECGLKTILVDTGVYTGLTNSILHPADHHVSDVKKAVELIIQLHNIRH